MDLLLMKLMQKAAGNRVTDAHPTETKLRYKNIACYTTYEYH
jgi:hypothetical protein